MYVARKRNRARFAILKWSVYRENSEKNVFRDQIWEILYQVKFILKSSSNRHSSDIMWWYRITDNVSRVYVIHRKTHFLDVKMTFFANPSPRFNVDNDENMNRCHDES